MTSKNTKAPVWGRALSLDARKQVEEAYGPLAVDLVELADMIEEVDKLFLSCLRKGRVPEGEDCLIEYGEPLYAHAGRCPFAERSLVESTDTIKPVMRILYSAAAVLFPRITRPRLYVDLMNALRFIRTDLTCADASGEAVVTTTFTWENRVCRDPFDPGADFNPCPVGRIYDGPWEYMGRVRDDGPRTMQLVAELHKMAAEATRETATQAADSRTADILDDLDDLDDLDRHIILLYQKAELCRSKGGVVRYPSDAQIAQAAYRARITTSRFTKQAISKRREKLRGMGLMPATKDKAKRCPDKLIDDMQGDNSRGKNQGKDKIRMKF